MKNQAMVTLVTTHLFVSAPTHSNLYPWFERVSKPRCLKKIILHTLVIELNTRRICFLLKKSF
jgi:hypothetical protein